MECELSAKPSDEKAYIENVEQPVAVEVDYEDVKLTAMANRELVSFASVHSPTVSQGAAVFFSAFAAFGQLLSITGPADIISFLISDLGRPDLAIWIIQAPTIVQGSLAPFVGRVSDNVGRRWLVILAPIFGLIGTIIASRANSMPMLIAGQAIMSINLTTVGLISSIASEVLPGKYRTWGQSAIQVAATAAGILSALATGALVDHSIDEWRNLFYIESAVFAAVSVGFFFTYHPPPRAFGANKSWHQVLHDADLVGSALIAAAFACIILGLNFGSSTYSYRDVHFYAPLTIGILLAFGLVAWEWKGRTDGIFHHGLLTHRRNFIIAAFALFIEGWIYFSGIAVYYPQQIRYIGWETDAFLIGVRKFAFNVVAMVMVIPILYFSTKFKDVKWILTFGFCAFLTAVACFSTATVQDDRASIAYSVVAAIGMAPQTVLLVMTAQVFASPPALIATASSLVATVRALGGALGSAVMGAELNNRLGQELPQRFIPAAIAGGLPESSIPFALVAFRSASPALIASIPGITPSLTSILTPIVRKVYAYSFRWAWITVIVPTAAGLFAILALDQVAIRSRMVKAIDATVERSAPYRNDRSLDVS
ncbi:MFS general substrate transporter [Atractiella rhizophila]|nr:MFS general substrate transporter [Atractiella rhizophila]